MVRTRIPDDDPASLALLGKHGACGDPAVDSAWFLPEASDAEARRAQRVCAGCPVKAECLAWATDHSEWGVWGGVMFRDKNNPWRRDPQLRDAAHRLFGEGNDYRRVAELLDISIPTAIGYHSAWRRQRSAAGRPA